MSNGSSDTHVALPTATHLTLEVPKLPPPPACTPDLALYGKPEQRRQMTEYEQEFAAWERRGSQGKVHSPGSSEPPAEPAEPAQEHHLHMPLFRRMLQQDHRHDAQFLLLHLAADQLKTDLLSTAAGERIYRHFHPECSPEPASTPPK